MTAIKTKIARIQLRKLCIREEFVRTAPGVQQAIGQNFEWNKFGAMVVQTQKHNTDHFDIVDGIIRKKVLAALNFPDSTQIPCVIIPQDADTVACRLAYNGYVRENYTARCRKNFKPKQVFELKYRSNDEKTLRVVDLLHCYNINIQWASQTGRAYGIPNNCRSAELFDQFSQEAGIEHVERLLKFLEFFKANGCVNLQSKALEACFLQAANRFLLAKSDWTFHSDVLAITIKGKPEKTTKVVGHIDLDSIYSDAAEFKKQHNWSQAIEMALSNYFTV